MQQSTCNEEGGVDNYMSRCYNSGLHRRYARVNDDRSTSNVFLGIVQVSLVLYHNFDLLFGKINTVFNCWKEEVENNMSRCYNSGLHR